MAFIGLRSTFAFDLQTLSQGRNRAVKLTGDRHRRGARSSWKLAARRQELAKNEKPETRNPKPTRVRVRDFRIA